MLERLNNTALSGQKGARSLELSQRLDIYLLFCEVGDTCIRTHVVVSDLHVSGALVVTESIKRVCYQSLRCLQCIGHWRYHHNQSQHTNASKGWGG